MKRGRPVAVGPDPRQAFLKRSPFSALDAELILRAADTDQAARWLARALREATRRAGKGGAGPSLENLVVSRILHTLGDALDRLARTNPPRAKTILAGAYRALGPGERDVLAGRGLPAELAASPRKWVRAARAEALANVGRTIARACPPPAEHPRSALRGDEIIWGRAPVRLDLGGGWTDTPPYALEFGGRVINAAVNLNGQPPVQVFARVVPEPIVLIHSIDHGLRLTIRTLDELGDYRRPRSQFGLAKAALTQAGFSAEAPWPRGTRGLPGMLKRFGGGIELTTLAAIPSGSGLGTSSVMGAVLLAVIHRMIGRDLEERELFHRVLQLEQELTTGGGWQDQIGGVLPGVKDVIAGAGLVPDPRVRPVRPDLLDPRLNGGETLLYYTGIRRLAKDILQHVVGKYLDRETGTMETLGRLRALPPEVAAAMRARDQRRFGRLIDAAWNLNKAIDPGSTTDEIEGILRRIGPFIRGAKLLGAGGGGFLLIVCRSPRDAARARTELESRPPNTLARFFDYEISSRGLTVTVS